MPDHHDHSHEPAKKPSPTRPESEVQDVGSRALAEALGSSFFFVKLVMVILIVVFALSGMNIISEQERALRLRFGKAHPELLGPGLVWAFPAPIDEIVRIKIGEIQTATSTVGWFANLPPGAIPPPQMSLNPTVDKYALTGDGNIVHARAVMGYRVTDAVTYVFNFTNAPAAIVQVLDAAMVWAAAGMTADEAILNKDVFRERIVTRVSQVADELKLGITVNTLNVDIVAPVSVQEEFRAVASAQQDRNSRISTAQGDAAAVLATARGEASAIINDGYVARTNYLTAIAADARAFDELLPEYLKNPGLFKQPRLAESMQRVLANADEKFILPVEVGGKPYELRLQLNRDPEAFGTNTPAR